MTSTATDRISILQFIKDPNLGLPFFDGDLSSWGRWAVALRCLYGLPIRTERGRKLVRECTGRDPDKFPAEGFRQSLILTGRRSGKSRISGCISAFEAVCGGHEAKLSPGERGLVVCIAPVKRQARYVLEYLQSVFRAPMLARMIEKQTASGMDLTNGISIEVMSGHYGHVRGATIVATVVDEAAFFGTDDASAAKVVRSDTELMRALRPALASTGGRLCAITSPYARKGWVYETWERQWGNDAGSILVWRAPSRTMNPTLPQSEVDAEMALDMASAKSEFYAEFRDLVKALVSRTTVEACVVADRGELLPQSGTEYFAFADLSGGGGTGKGDDAALCIGHVEDGAVVVDVLRRYRPPFDPNQVCADIAREAKRFGCRSVTGDRWGSEFVRQAMVRNGMPMRYSKEPKAALYLELLPRLTSRTIELPDDKDLVDQIAGLERRTRAGGHDIVDHAPGGHDDLANVCAGMASIAAKQPRIVRAV